MSKLSNSILKATESLENLIYSLSEINSLTKENEKNIQELKEDKYLLKSKLIALCPEMKEWVQKNFGD